MSRKHKGDGRQFFGAAKVEPKVSGDETEPQPAARQTAPEDAAPPQEPPSTPAPSDSDTTRPERLVERQPGRKRVYVVCPGRAVTTRVGRQYVGGERVTADLFERGEQDVENLLKLGTIAED